MSISVILIAAGVVVFLTGWALLLIRIVKTERLILRVLRYILDQYGDELPPHVAELLPTGRRGAHRG